MSTKRLLVWRFHAGTSRIIMLSVCKTANLWADGVE